MKRAILWGLLFAAGLAAWYAASRITPFQEQHALDGRFSVAAARPRECIQGVAVRQDSFDADGDSLKERVEIRQTPFRDRYLARWAPRPGFPEESAVWAVANHLLVTFTADTTPAEARQILQTSLSLAGLEIGKLPLPGTFLVQAPWQPATIPDQGPAAYLLSIAPRLRGRAKVLRVSPDYLYFSLALRKPDPGILQDDLRRIGAAQAWRVSKGSPEVRVAVLDTGVGIGHPDLVHNIPRWPNGQVVGWNFHDKKSDPSDDNGHGTWCAGIIGARGGDGNGLAGVNWFVSILPIKFLDRDGCGTTADAISGIAFAVIHGANVISNSWGGAPYSPELDLAVRIAGIRKVLFVAGAGNDPRDLDRDPFFPAALRLPNVISVGGVNDADVPVPDWGRGSRAVHLSAPGIGVYSTLPSGSGGDSGTSASTAFVSGACALVQAATKLRYLDIRRRILESSYPLSGAGGASCSQGRLDLANAVQSRAVLRRVNCR